MYNRVKKLAKKSAVLGMTGLFALSLTACGSSEDAATTSKESEQEKTEISLYTGGSLNVKEFWQEVIPAFEEEHQNIDVELVFLPAGQGGQSTMDRLIAAKKANKDSEVDIYEGGLADIVVGEEEGLFTELNESNIPNLANVKAENLEGTNGLAVPHRASSVVLAYNSDVVKEVPETPEEMYQWIKDNPGRFAYNDPTTGGSGSSFVLTTIYNQLPPEAMNVQDESIMEDWDKGFDILSELDSYMYREGVYPKKNQGTLDLLANGEVDIIPAWSDMALEQLDKELIPENIKLKQLTPGFTGGPAYMMLADNGEEERTEAAETFLNYVLTPEVQETVVNKMYGYPGIEWEFLDEEMQKNFESVSGDYRIFNGGKLGEEVNKRWQKEIASQ
ncbi:extracellular solute-binding protein [Pontibacillus litoralis]|uniref:ABC transporter substrate-binding protein n=1 Tax=Pontibacillus litoralis JSM 072002 TaxID=1385512 RepID=A0A0A5G0H6_9BACI|nr:extracellular solute-binding protein [Pontibacillus litoralis]KGX86606.1 ABC transporter substrate-binding protein [Pontibacillus litoralis JSM 072002]